MAYLPFRLTLITTLALLSCGSAVAASETWYLENAVLSNGEAVTGSFAFDASTNIYSNIQLQVGTVSFGIPDPVSPGNAQLLSAVTTVSGSLLGTPVLFMNWVTPLTALGGTDAIDPKGFSYFSTCADASCGSLYGSGANFATFVSGDATTAPVPEPGTLAMLAAGLGIMGCAARRRADIG